MLYVLWILDFLTAVCCFPSNLISVCQCSSQLSMNIWEFQNQSLFQKQWLRIGEDLTGVSLQWELFLYQWSMGKNNQYLSAKCNINIIWNRFHYPGDQKSVTPPSNLSAPKRGTGAVTTSSLPSWPMSLAAARLSMKSLPCCASYWNNKLQSTYTGFIASKQQWESCQVCGAIVKTSKISITNSKKHKYIINICGF